MTARRGDVVDVVDGNPRVEWIDDRGRDTATVAREDYRERNSAALLKQPYGKGRSF